MTDFSALTKEELDKLTYEKFLENFELYSTYKEAKKPGFEAHHVTPIYVQMSNKGFKGTRKEFTSTEEVDDVCIRCTCFEHLLAHYLIEKDYGFEPLISFIGIYNMKKYKLAEKDLTSLERLKMFGDMMIHGRQVGIAKITNFWKNLSDSEREKIGKDNSLRYQSLSDIEKERNREIHREASNRPEVKARISESLKLYNKNMSPERREEIRENHLESVRTPEHRALLSKLGKERFENMTVEDLEKRSQSLIQGWAKKPKEEMEKLKERKREKWKNKSQEEKSEISRKARERYDNLSNEEKELNRQRSYDLYHSKTEEEKLEFSRKIKEIKQRPENRAKQSKALKAYNENLTHEEKEEKSRATKERYESKSEEWKNNFKVKMKIINSNPENIKKRVAAFKETVNNRTPEEHEEFCKIQRDARKQPSYIAKLNDFKEGYFKQKEECIDKGLTPLTWNQYQKLHAKELKEKASN